MEPFRGVARARKGTLWDSGRWDGLAEGIAKTEMAKSLESSVRDELVLVFVS